MKRTSPVVIVLSGLAVAAVLIGLGWQAPRFFKDQQAAGLVAAAPASPTPEVPGEGAGPVPEESATVPPPAPGETPDREQLAEAAPLTGTWAGRLKPGSLAIAAKNGKAIAYLCDGERIESWLKGTAVGGKLNLTGKGGATLTGTADGKTAKGKIKVRDLNIDFTIETVKKPSGLYRFASKVRGANVVGGWIVTKDGEQVGLATVDGALVKPSALDVQDRTATVGGNEVTAVPAEDSAQ
ncbi:hypothetical protein AB0M20_41540 [Actinoplanes sp. NPDC051633]|uniref:hypothetical protein n=1 Tax=Actinoplanes sp. NPDC051633 TaxID=3155670 RepID=UPI0034330999